MNLNFHMPPRGCVGVCIHAAGSLKRYLPQFSQISAGTSRMTTTVLSRYSVTEVVPGRVCPILQIAHSWLAQFSHNVADTDDSYVQVLGYR